MRVLMFGWEFPPHVSGGLGTACHGMTVGLAKNNTEVIFVVPKIKGENQGMDSHLNALLSASGVSIPNAIYNKMIHKVERLWTDKIQVRSVESLLFPYATYSSYYDNMLSFNHREELSQTSVTSSHGSTTITLQGDYGADLLSEVFRYSQAAASLSLTKNFDIIHAHDWMTYPAAILARELSKKPFVAHIHATEYDRSGENINHEVAKIESMGLHAADRIIAVSHYTKNIIVQKYGIDPNKVDVVHNAVRRDQAKHQYKVNRDLNFAKLVLFMGRVTFQKGPDYFIDAANLVLQKMPDVHFIMAGSGDMLSRMVRRVAQLRIGNRVHFTGFLRGADVDKMYAMCDLYVMPSVSEPFGIAPLEAMVYDVPVLISKQSGVSEVVINALKVDFWDIKEIANKICAVLSYPKLSAEMVKNCHHELKNIRWFNAAKQINEVYQRTLEQ